MSYARTFILGNLCRDPEVRVTPKGTAICTFSVAVSKKFKDDSGGEREETSFFDIEAWGKTGENISRFFTKGKPIFIDCRPKQDSWEDKQTQQKRSKIKFVVNEWQFAGGDKGESQGQQSRPSTPNPQHAKPAQHSGNEGLDEDVPF